MLENINDSYKTVNEFQSDIKERMPERVTSELHPETVDWLTMELAIANHFVHGTFLKTLSQLDRTIEVCKSSSREETMKQIEKLRDNLVEIAKTR